VVANLSDHPQANSRGGAHDIPPSVTAINRIPDWLRVRVGTMQTNDSQQQRWRDRAREIRALGDQMHDRLAKDEMLRLANKYERLADWTEEQARHSSAIP
jgi:hypothetical protein